MLSVPDASCAGDNPLGGQHLRDLTLNVCAPFYIVSHYLHSAAILALLTYTMPHDNSNGKERYRACRWRLLMSPGTYDRCIKLNFMRISL